jgi:hypothetical protein
MKNNFELIPSRSNKLVDENGNTYESLRQLESKIGVQHSVIGKKLKKDGYFKFNGVTYYAVNTRPVVQAEKEEKPAIPVEEQADFEEFKKMKDVRNLGFTTYKFSYTPKKQGSRYAVALFSDAHIEETVNPASVLGMNEYNISIAEKRIQCYFENLCECLKEDKVDDLIFASLGDTISGYIHDELAQCNGLSPLEATEKAQSLILSGLKYLCEETNLHSIKFIGIVGNHSRTTKKIQHANGFKMSYEWLMYQNLQKFCEMSNLPIEFCIPESEVAIVNSPDGQKLMFAHGFQIKGGGNGTVCGIYPALNRLALKWGKVFGQDKIYIGHFHQCVSINNAVVNGSIIGFNTFALTNGMPFEEPAQMYEVYDTNIGQLLTRKIYCK